MNIATFRIFLLFLALAGLVGCADQPRRDFDEGKQKLSEGQVEMGMAQIEKAAKGDPENVEYSKYLYEQRERRVNELNSKAEAEQDKGAFDEAVADYERALSIDPRNERAKGGLDQVHTERKLKLQLEDASQLFSKGQGELALTKLDRILAEDPKQADAKALKLRIQEKAVEDRPASASPEYTAALKKTISLEFKDANLKSVFDVISRVSDLNFVFDKDVKPELRATILVKNTTIAEAIKLLLVTNQLAQQVLNGNTILIYPDTAAKLHDYQQQEVKSYYLANADVKRTIEMLKTILKVKDVFADETKSLLVVRDSPEVIRLADKLIADEDVPDPEVELEVEILEISSTHLHDIGMQYPQQLSASLGTASTTGTSSTFTLNQWLTRDSTFVNFAASNPAFILNLQESDSDTKLLANPRIRVKDREKANVHIGQRLPVLTTVSTAGVGSSSSVNYIEVGLKLDVEPSIRMEDQVDMKVKLEVSSVTQTITDSAGNQVYEIGTRNADTVLRLQDGETEVLAGLIQNNDTTALNKVPGMGDIPLFGHLFSNDNTNNQKDDLVLLITPHIVRSVDRPGLLSRQFASGTDSAIGTQMTVTPALPAKPAEAPASGAVVPTAVPVSAPAVPAQQVAVPQAAAVPKSQP